MERKTSILAVTNPATLEGLITEAEGKVLADYASRVPPHLAIVEVGSYKGKSAAYLASRSEAHIYCVDAWGLDGNTPGRFRYDLAYEVFIWQTEPWRDRITPIVGFSTDVAHDWTLPIGLLWIDGSHHYLDVLADLEAWWPHVQGPVLLDDFDTPRNPGVRKALDTFGRPYRNVGRVAIIE